MNTDITLPEEEAQALTAKFSQFEAEVKQRIEHLGLYYDNVLTYAQPEMQVMQLTFTPEEETQLDDLIRYVRNHLSSNFIVRGIDVVNGPYPVAAFKHFIQHAHQWSLMFCFAERWECQETIQFGG